jgi:hypothetical protein
MTISHAGEKAGDYAFSCFSQAKCHHGVLNRGASTSDHCAVVFVYWKLMKRNKYNHWPPSPSTAADQADLPLLSVSPARARLLRHTLARLAWPNAPGRADKTVVSGRQEVNPLFVRTPPHQLLTRRRRHTCSGEFGKVDCEYWVKPELNAHTAS